MENKIEDAKKADTARAERFIEGFSKKKAGLVYAGSAFGFGCNIRGKEYDDAWGGLVYGLGDCNDATFDAVVVGVCEKGKGEKLSDWEMMNVQAMLYDCHN